MKPAARASPHRGWIGTTRRNTLIGVDHGIGSGRMALAHLNQMTMESSVGPDDPVCAAHLKSLDALEQARRNALRDLGRRKRVAIARAAQHDQRLRRASRVAQRDLDLHSQYGRYLG